ncbi:cilium assembly protein DZIP1 [Bombina bombina]|uniref:cilium assembly protein DZIP1 n=1 Tax=Bombina bombina TaxID=8345 RepID=UPI00235A660A|nr:cilium assembly protein DZIP1 [Bombina bombina]
MPSSSHGAAFRFRLRHESVDWRRIAAIDVDKVANELNFVMLQDNIMNITFCNLENEKCPQCQHSLDPVLLKLFRLAQLTIEYLLHSQEYLTSHLQTLEDKLQAAHTETEESNLKMKKQFEIAKSLKQECKRRKKLIATQQILINSSANSYHKCLHCDKAFMNYSFLQSHMQRRHQETASHEKLKLRSTDKLQNEITKLKEELHLTKSKLEDQQSAQLESLSKEMEHGKLVEQELNKKFDMWKEDEQMKLSEEMTKVKNMFRQEFQEVTKKNESLEEELQKLKKDNSKLKSSLDTLQECSKHNQKAANTKCHHSIPNVEEILEIKEKKWENMIQLLRQEHKTEKNQLLSQIENLRLTYIEENATKSDFYKKRLDDTGIRCQEEKEIIRAPKEKIIQLPLKSSTDVKNQPAPGPVTSTVQVETKPNTVLTFGQSQILEPIQELTEDDGDDYEEESSSKKMRLIKALKKDPMLTKELRSVLDQGLADKLESLGIQPGTRGISSDQLKHILNIVEFQRAEKEKIMPEMQTLRKKLSRCATLKVQEHSPSWKSSSPTLSADVKSYPIATTDSKISKLKPSLLHFSQDEFKPEQQYTVPIKSSTPKRKPVSSKEIRVLKSSSLTTSPFSSSDDESHKNDTPLSSYKYPVLLKPKDCMNKRDNIGLVATDSESEGSFLEELDRDIAHRHRSQMPAPAKPPRATVVKELSNKTEKQPASRAFDNKPANYECHSVVTKDAVMELKISDFDDSDFDSSPLEDEAFEVPRPIQCKQNPSKYKNEFPTRNVPFAAKLSRGDAREADTSSTLVSSLVSVSDLSDSSDV